jgi:hypothetical protein
MSGIAMTTLAELRQEIADDLARSDLTTSIDKEIKAAISFFEEERFYFSETRSSTFNTVIDEVDYDVTDFPDLPKFAKIESLWEGAGTAKRQITRLSSMEMEDKRETRSGRPAEFCLLNGVLTLYPTPDKVYTIRALGYKKLDVLSADGDTNVWLTEAYDLIRARAASKVCAFKINDLNAAQNYQVLEDRELVQLRQKTEARNLSNMMLQGSGL